MTREIAPPIVPDELQPLLTEEVLAAHDRFTDYTLDDIRERTGLSAGRKGHADRPYAVSFMSDGDPEAGIHVLALPHQQAWKPSMAIRALLYHEINNPDGVTVVLPNGSVTSKYYELTSEARAKVSGGDMRPYYELQTRLVESAVSRYDTRGPVELSGYSLGGLTVTGIGAVGSDMLDIQRINSVEAPNLERKPKQLRKDFTKSGGPLAQRAAIADAKLPVLSQALRADRLLVDYVRFGVAQATNPDNKALARGMASPDYDNLIADVLRRNDSAVLHLGHVVGSKLFDPSAVTIVNERVIIESYSGEGAHKHATGDNPIAHALMMSR